MSIQAGNLYRTMRKGGAQVEHPWIDRLLQGDRQAFRSMYDDYFDYAMRTGRVVTRNAEWAKDAVQETFLRVYRNIWQYDRRRAFRPWFYTILLRECYRVMEREKKVVPFGEQLERIAADAKLPDVSVDLYDALQSLNDMYRIPLILKYLHDYSEKEIAVMLDVNVNTLKSRLLKGREKLKKGLGGRTLWNGSLRIGCARRAVIPTNGRNSCGNASTPVWTRSLPSRRGGGEPAGAMDR